MEMDFSRFSCRHLTWGMEIKWGSGRKSLITWKEIEGRYERGACTSFQRKNRVGEWCSGWFEEGVFNNVFLMHPVLHSFLLFYVIDSRMIKKNWEKRASTWNSRNYHEMRAEPLGYTFYGRQERSASVIYYAKSLWDFFFFLSFLCLGCISMLLTLERWADSERNSCILLLFFPSLIRTRAGLQFTWKNKDRKEPEGLHLNLSGYKNNSRLPFRDKNSRLLLEFLLHVLCSIKSTLDLINLSDTI